MRLMRNIWFSFTFALAIVLTGCKTCVPVIEYRDSVRTEYKLDSVYVYKHDSIFRDRWREGDTVFVTTDRWRVMYKDKIVEVHDTIRTNTEIVQERKVVPSFYKGCTIALWVLIACVVLYIVVRVVIRIYLHK